MSWPNDPQPDAAFPFWLRHPILWFDDVIAELVSTVETYTALPLSIALGGAAIYYLRRG